MERKHYFTVPENHGRPSFSVHHALGNLSDVRIIVGDITRLEVSGLIFYARPDLQLGSGYGGMIRRQGGAVIQKELNAQAPRNVGDAVVTSGGNLATGFIVHSVGPDPGEPMFEAKLKGSMANALMLCDEMGADRVAMPPLGLGYHGVSIETCAATTMAAIRDISTRLRTLSEIVICMRDEWTVPIFSRSCSMNGQRQGDQP